MRDYELEGLKSLGLKGKTDIVAWRAKTGLQYRVKVRNTTGRLVYISDLRSEKKQKLIADYYKVPIKKLKERLLSTYRPTERFRHIPGKNADEYVYQNLRDDEFYDRLEQVLLQQDNALKFQVAIGYTLVDKNDPLVEKNHAPSFNNDKTTLFGHPMVVNTRNDAKSIVKQARRLVLDNCIDYNESIWVLKSINQFSLRVYHRNHKLGSEAAVISEVIRLKKHVVNFPQPPQSNKCLMFCIAYHLQEGDKPARDRMSALTKAVVRKYLAYKGQVYTDKKFPAAYKNLPPVDIYQLSDFEDCFKINIEVYMMDEATEEFRRAIESKNTYDSTLNILSHNNHAMLITDITRFIGKHECSKCEMVFISAEKLRNHKMNKCDKAYFKSFVKAATMYRPTPNKINAMLERLF
ncbi:Hypothetical protein PHPALM_38116 [Phytophthora palmivora]|uniref:Uncharacterized protein n=1 Tax=Phytophthora palmivora TaxID=4796 RepID=A0A2P4WVR9_9STRA|nr:Hypothetical protein PHPALM_38116 [Phytophthora palmivora]